MRRSMKITASSGTALIDNVAVALLGAQAARAQSGVTLFGALTNFDVLNDTGKETYGFEILKVRDQWNNRWRREVIAAAR